jgi:hypothetical protein
MDDISVLLPVEHFDTLSKVIEMGLQRAKISHMERTNLAAWWEAEKALIAEEINNSK